MQTNIAKGIIAGLVATAVLSALMVAKTMIGLMPQLNAIRMLSDMAHEFMGTPATPMVGWLLHAIIGSLLWGSLFALLVRVIPGATPAIKGMVFGTAAWLLMMVMVMPMAGAGLFAVKLGAGSPVATLMLHWVFGAVLGQAYARLTTSAATLVDRHA